MTDKLRNKRFEQKRFGLNNPEPHSILSCAPDTAKPAFRGGGGWGRGEREEPQYFLYNV